IDNDGKQDVVFMMIDHPGGKNQAFYRVGKGLDRNGNVNAGWGPWMEIPDWFSFENQHGAITLSDLDGDGTLELIVLMVDAPVGVNAGKYRVGRKLNAQGVVTGGWTPWIDVPDWFSWENEGAGIATIASKTLGKKDLVVFQ